MEDFKVDKIKKKKSEEIGAVQNEKMKREEIVKDFQVIKGQKSRKEDVIKER